MHTRHPGIVRTWKCRFTKQGNYIIVFEWDTVERMRERLINNSGRLDMNKYYGNAWGCATTNAVVIRYPGGKRFFPKKYGEIHVVKDNYGFMVIGHEIQHIVSHYILDKGWDLEKDGERIATVAGILTQKFMDGYYRKEKI